LVGLDQVRRFPSNDSKDRFWLAVDRHEHIGKGKIGKEAFRHIVNDPRFARYARLPGNAQVGRSARGLENLAVLRSLVSKPANGAGQRALAKIV
jgi:deoxyribonuclease-4